MTILTEKSPPGWAGTIKAMKRHMPDAKAFALAWDMYKKGAKPHYKSEPTSTSGGEPVLKKKYRSERLSDRLSTAMTEVHDTNESLEMAAAGLRQDVQTYQGRVDTNINDNEARTKLATAQARLKAVQAELTKGQRPLYYEDIDEMFGEAAIEEGLLTEKGKHYYDGKNYYADTAFLNSIGDVMSGMELKHMGFGEFAMSGNGKSIDFDRTRGKKFKGQSGRSHQVYDNKKGALVKELIKQMEKKGKSELVREEAELEEGKGQDHILKKLRGGGWLALTNVARGYLGHFKNIERAAKALVKQGKVQMKRDPREGDMLKLKESQKSGVAGQLEMALHEEPRLDALDERMTAKQAVTGVSVLDAEHLRSDNPELKRELDRMVIHTRKFVRGLDELEGGAEELVQAAKETERVRRTTGLEMAMRRSPLGNASRSFQAHLNKLYGFSAESHNSALRLAKMARLPTRRASKRQTPAKSSKEITATNLVREVLQITAKMNGRARESGELGSVVIREAEKLLNQKSVISGDRLLERLMAIIQVQLDFRDQVSGGLYAMIGAVVKRMNEITRRLMKMNEDTSLHIILAPWLSDPKGTHLLKSGAEDENIVIVEESVYSQGNGWLAAVAVSLLNPASRD